MPRSAILTAITHDGKDILLAGRTKPLTEVRRMFQDIRGTEHHKDYRSVSYQESDGMEQVRHFRTAKEQEALKLAQKKADEDTAKRIADAAKNPARYLPGPVEKVHEIMTKKPEQFPAKTSADKK